MEARIRPSGVPSSYLRLPNTDFMRFNYGQVKLSNPASKGKLMLPPLISLIVHRHLDFWLPYSYW